MHPDEEEAILDQVLDKLELGELVDASAINALIHRVSKPQRRLPKLDFANLVLQDRLEEKFLALVPKGMAVPITEMRAWGIDEILAKMRLSQAKPAPAKRGTFFRFCCHCSGQNSGRSTNQLP